MHMFSLHFLQQGILLSFAATCKLTRLGITKVGLLEGKGEKI